MKGCCGHDELRRKILTNATTEPVTPLWGEDTERESVPVTGDAER